MSPLTTTSITSRFLVAILDDAKVEVEDVLLAAGLTREALSSPDCRMPLDPFQELWTRVARLRPDIGLRLVDVFPDGQMHILAHLAMRSATVGAAMEAVCRYAPVTSSADFMQCKKMGEVAFFSYEHRASGPGNPWLSEHYFSMIVSFLSRAAGRALPISKIEFALPAKAPLPAYKARFGLMPAFDTGRNMIEFDASVLDWPLLTSDSYMHGILDKVVKATYGTAQNPANVSASYLETVRREITRSFLNGVTPTIEMVALASHSSVRNLRDKLASENTTFRQLLDDARRDLASEHLSHGLSVNETAYLLGFSEPSAFQHACKRWFDKSAGEVRRELVAGLNAAN